MKSFKYQRKKEGESNFNSISVTELTESILLNLHAYDGSYLGAAQISKKDLAEFCSRLIGHPLYVESNFKDSE